jgi:hypothetical protein
VWQIKHNELNTCFLGAHLLDVGFPEKDSGARQGVSTVAVALIGYVTLMACLKLANGSRREKDRGDE